nr:cytochrome c biogenesis FC [Plantago media]
MIQAQTILFFITFLVVLGGTSAPVFWKYFLSRDVSTGAPFSNAILIPIFFATFTLLIYLHARQFLQLMNQKRAGYALFSTLLILHFVLLQVVWHYSTFESFCGVFCFLFFCTFFLLTPTEETVKKKIYASTRAKGLVTILTSQDYEPSTSMNLSHTAVSTFLLGVLLSNTMKVEFTQRLPLGSELHLGKERCCLRGIDHLHGPSFHSICGNFLIYPDRRKEGTNLRDHLASALTTFPEKRTFRESTTTTEVAIHTNFLTDFYLLVGSGLTRTGGWYTTLMKLPFIFLIWLGFLLAAIGGSFSLLHQLQRKKYTWY